MARAHVNRADRPPINMRRWGSDTIAVAALLALMAGTGVRAATPTINPTNRFAYGSNIGWLDWRAGGGGNGAVIGEYVCSGYIYAANVGWIHLGDGSPANGIGYQNNSAADYGVNHDGLGNLRGLAWGANIGWVNFETNGAPRFDLFNGRFSGNAWSANCGWVSLSNAVAYVQTDTMLPGTDSDGDGIADAFELIWTGGLGAMNGTTDTDGDGASDLDEYLAGTNPTNPADQLVIVSLNSNLSNTLYTITWLSQQTRSYSLQTRSNLNVGTPWITHPIGTIFPDPGLTIVRTATDSPTSERYFRIKAARPLVP